MVDVWDGLPISFTHVMNEELVKPFTIIEFLKVVKGMVDGKAAWQHTHWIF